MCFNPIWHLSLVTKHCSVMMMCHDNVCCFADSFSVMAGFVVVAMVMFAVVWGDVICILLLRCSPLALLYYLDAAFDGFLVWMHGILHSILYVWKNRKTQQHQVYFTMAKESELCTIRIYNTVRRMTMLMVGPGTRQA